MANEINNEEKMKTLHKAYGVPSYSGNELEHENLIYEILVDDCNNNYVYILDVKKQTNDPFFSFTFWGEDKGKEFQHDITGLTKHGINNLIKKLISIRDRTQIVK